MQFVIFQNKDEWEQFLEAFKSENGGSYVGEDPQCGLGPTAAETCDKDGNPDPNSRRYYCHSFTEEQIAIFLLSGIEVRTGGIDGPRYGEESTD